MIFSIHDLRFTIYHSTSLHPEYIISSVFDKRVADAVADAVEEPLTKRTSPARDRAAQEGTQITEN